MCDECNQLVVARVVLMLIYNATVQNVPSLIVYQQLQRITGIANFVQVHYNCLGASIQRVPEDLAWC